MVRPTDEITSNATILRALLELKKEVEEISVDNYLDLVNNSLKDVTPEGNQSTVNLRMTRTNNQNFIKSMPVANSQSAGVMNPATFIAIQENSMAIDVLKGSTLTYPNMANELVEGMSSGVVEALFVQEYPSVTKLDGTVYQNIDNTFAYRWYISTSSWIETQPVSIRPFSLDYAGTIKGSELKFQVFPEPDGTGSVNGLDDLEEKVNNNTIDKCYPVGSIYMGINATNPSQLFGFGTWERFGNGKVLVGVSEGETEFNTVNKTGGTKYQVLLEHEMPPHKHSLGNHSHTVFGHNHTVYGAGAHNHAVRTSGNSYHGAQGGSSGVNNELSSTVGDHTHNLSAVGDTQTGGTSGDTGTTGGEWGHNNLQPYITVYMWLRTA